MNSSVPRSVEGVDLGGSEQGHGHGADHRLERDAPRKSQFSHKSVNLIFILLTITDKLTDLWENRLLQNNFMSTLCEIW